MPRLPDPFSTNLEQFSEVVDTLAQLLAEKKVRLKSSPGSSISFRVEPYILNGIIQNKGIDQTIALRALNEISVITSLKLRERVHGYFDTLVEEMHEREDISPEEGKKIRDTLHKKLNLVETRIINRRVEQKFFLSRATKHDSLVDFSWEIVERKYDKDEGKKANGVVAVVRFDFASRPFLEFLPSVLSLSEFQRRKFVFELDEDDVQELYEDLENIMKRLSEEREE